MTLEPEQIQKIVAQVVAQVRERHGLAPPPSPPEMQPGLGLYATVDEAVRAARAAFRRLDALPLARREVIIRQMRQAARESAQVLAYEAWSETGMGRYEDKIQKNLLVADKTPGTEIIRPQVFTGDHGLTLIEYAPYGVIGSITPSTNPTSTILNNAIGMVAAGNAVVFNVHPMAKRVSAHTVAILNEAIMRAGGPGDLLTCVVEPTIESAKELMRHPGVDLLVVTGGEAVVHEAMHSGKKAICAGPGNPPVVVDETADIAQAARDIIRGASFDNNIICVDEKEVFVVASVADQLKAAMKALGAVELNSWQLNRLLKAIFTENRGSGQQSVFNKRFVGQNASVLLKEIGIHAGDEVRLIIAEVEDPRHPLVWTEQLMPVLPIVRVRNAQQAIDLAVEAEHGFRHTASMFSRNIDHLSMMARAFQGSIFVKNGPNIAGLGADGEGFTSFTIASPTGEGLTTALTFTRVRRCVLKDSFRII
ncbi:MAG: aldehyde dehydrogenase EutE [Ardenticatenia bacterium]|jgi:acyl-CoA reductase-like NAD-dependent aldehyde dehydrogenase|nr:MAG: aldehyde dehydrogenase EutE [Ardenticatenia bacterium]